MNYFDLLPNEAIYEICQYMSFRHLVRLKEVSRRFNQLCVPILSKKISKLPVRLVIFKSKFNPQGFIFVGWFPQGIPNSEIKGKFCAYSKSNRMEIIDLKIDTPFLDFKDLMCYYYYDEPLDKIMHLVMIKHDVPIKCSCSVANDTTFNKHHFRVFNPPVMVGNLDHDVDLFYDFINCWNTGLLGPEGCLGSPGALIKTDCPVTRMPIKKVEVDKIYYLTTIVNHYSL